MLRGAPGATAPGASVYAVCDCVWLCVTVRNFVSTPRGRRTFSYLHDDDSAAGRTFSPTGHRHVARLKPTTPLRPPMQASVKPPSPLLTPQQQPLKPTTPLQPKNTPKTPISHPQRRQGFQPHTGTSKQRRWRFQLAHLTGPQRRRRFQTTAHLASGIQLHHQRHPCAHPQKTRTQFDWVKFQ